MCKLHPMQEIVKDDQGTMRFRSNEIVRYLLDHGGIDMNALAMLDFPDEDHMQFAQLIGYSVGGYGELSYVTDESYDVAERELNQVPQHTYAWRQEVCGEARTFAEIPFGATVTAVDGVEVFATCEGCGKQITEAEDHTTDSEGVDLCRGCMDALIKETIEEAAKKG